MASTTWRDQHPPHQHLRRPARVRRLDRRDQRDGPEGGDIDIPWIVPVARSRQGPLATPGALCLKAHQEPQECRPTDERPERCARTVLPAPRRQACPRNKEGVDLSCRCVGVRGALQHPSGLHHQPVTADDGRRRLADDLGGERGPCRVREDAHACVHELRGGQPTADAWPVIDSLYCFAVNACRLSRPSSCAIRSAAFIPSGRLTWRALVASVDANFSNFGVPTSGCAKPDRERRDARLPERPRAM